MAHQHIHPQSLAFVEEVTPCVAPSDWTLQTAIEFVSMDISGIKEALVADPTAERRAFRVGERAKRKGIRNCSASFVLKLHGIGEQTADGMQAPNTYLARLFKHCLGEAVRGRSTTITAGTTTVPIVVDTADIIPGVILMFEDTTAPTAQNAGILHPRRVKSVNVGTKAVTLTEALPFTPAVGDIVHATITAALSTAYLVDAVAAGGLVQWFVKRENYNVTDDLLWTLEGSVASMKIDGLGRGALPTVTLDVQAANFRHGAGDGLANVALATPVGHAQLTMGTNTRLLLSPAASTVAVERDPSSFSFDVGMTRKPTMSVTERMHRFDGLSSYSFDPGASTISIVLTGYSEGFYQQLAADQEFRITLYQPGDGSGAGKAWCIHAGKARLIETPARTDVDMVHGVTLKFQLCEPEDCTGGSNEDLEQSRFLIALG